MKTRSKILIIILPIVLLVVIFLGTTIYLGHDYIKAPQGHVRNDRFVIGLYSQSFGFGTTNNMVASVIDLYSPSKKERNIVHVGPQRTAIISSIDFHDSTTAEIIVTNPGGDTLDEFLINLEDESINIVKDYENRNDL